MNDTKSTADEKQVQLIENDYGIFEDKTTGKSIPLRSFTWKNQNSIEVQVVTYGGTITSLKVPDQQGVIQDIVLGFDNIQGYLNPLNPYFGATVGRVANRIANGQFEIDGHKYQVSTNRGHLTLHGGYRGFDQVVWDYDVQGTTVTLSYLSKDDEEGFPGNVLTNLKYQLTNDNEFKIEMKAYTTKPTYVNLTNHSYFNLAGHNKGADEIYKHSIQINASNYTLTDSDSIPTGKIAKTGGTIFELETPKILGDVINKVSGGGYDDNFCVNTTDKKDLVFVSRAIHVPSQRTMEVYSNQPGVQFYTANFLPTAADKNELIGKNNSKYLRHGAFCFETQNYPDAINHKNFPNAVLRPGETYTNITHFVFPQTWKM